MRARRATVEDLPQLVSLWRLERLTTDDLEKRFTEFQVVVDDAGVVLGTVGIQVLTHHGHLHSECMARPELGDELREMLWQRVQMVARNHSVDRIWTRMSHPFWRATGFRPATDEEMEVMPEPLGEKRGWNLLLLRGAEGTADAIEKQFAMLRALHAAESQKVTQRVSTLKKVAMALTILVALLVITFAIVVFRYGPQLFHRAPQ